MERTYHDETSVKYHADQHLPILRQVLREVNPRNAEIWTYIFAKAGITDGSFPATRSAFHATAQQLGLTITEVEVENFLEAQYRYLCPPVEGARMLTYDDAHSTPYKEIPNGVLGSGSFGIVEKVCTYLQPSKVYARKRLMKITDKDRPRVEKEIVLLQRFRHPHSIMFHGGYLHRGQIFLLFDLATCNLAQFLASPPSVFVRLSSDEKSSKIVNWMIDMAAAVAYLHGIQGIHRNLKPENLLIDNTGRIFLADCGLDALQEAASTYTTSIEGTERYTAPDHTQGWNKVYGRSADCWALGCIYLELLAFGTNISLEYFQTFRQIHGGRNCQASRNTCYRHNMKAVALFISGFLRHRSQAVERIVDLIDYDILTPKEYLRLPARDIRQRLLDLSDGFSFFKKDDCCSNSRTKNPKNEASMNSILGRIGSLSITGESDMRNIDISGSVGPLNEAFL